MPPPENELTKCLVTTLERCSRKMTEAFLAEVVGLEDTKGPYVYGTQITDVAEERPPLGVVVGIAPVAGLATKDPRSMGSQPDALISCDRCVVLIEFKTVGRPEHMQLVRHAQEWAFDVPTRIDPWEEADPPPGFGTTTWQTVGGWLARLLAARDTPSDDRLALRRLADRLVSERLLTLDASTPGADAVAPARVLEDPEPTSLREILAPYDVARLRDACRPLFEPGGRCHVRGGDTRECEADAERLRGAYARAGKSLPALLDEFDPMTPYRVLTVQFCSEGLGHAYPRHWTTMRNRVLHRGGDQAVLLAMAAWASRASGQRVKNVQRTVQQVWAATEPEAPGLDDLHHAVRTARR